LSFDECQKALDAAGQGHVLKFWKKLSAEEQQSLLEQIATLNFDDIARMASYLDDKGQATAQADFAPAAEKRFWAMARWALSLSQAVRAHDWAMMAPRGRMQSLR
jgi:hypothetical protein